MSTRLVTGGVLAVIGLITIKVLGVILGLTLGFFALMFKLLPIVLIAYVLYRVVKYLGRPSTA